MKIINVPLIFKLLTFCLNCTFQVTLFLIRSLLLNFIISFINLAMDMYLVLTLSSDASLLRHAPYVYVMYPACMCGLLALMLTYCTKDYISTYNMKKTIHIPWFLSCVHNISMLLLWVLDYCLFDKVLMQSSVGIYQLIVTIISMINLVFNPIYNVTKVDLDKNN